MNANFYILAYKYFLVVENLFSLPNSDENIFSSVQMQH